MAGLRGNQTGMQDALATPQRPDDKAAIRALEAAYDRAWNAGDLAAAMEAFAADVVVIDPSGGTSVGREGVQRSLASLLAGVGRGSTHISEIIGIHFVTDDVALVDGEAVIEGFTADDGSTMAPLHHRFTDVLVKEEAGWLIAHVRAYVFMSQPQ